MSYSIDLRDRVLSYIEEGGTKYEASRLFGVGRATIYRWLKRPFLAPTPCATRQRMIDKARLAAHVRDYPDLLLRERAIVFSVTPSGLWRAMRKQGFGKKNNALRCESFR